MGVLICKIMGVLLIMESNISKTNGTLGG